MLFACVVIFAGLWAIKNVFYCCVLNVLNSLQTNFLKLLIRNIKVSGLLVLQNLYICLFFYVESIVKLTQEEDRV